MTAKEFLESQYGITLTDKKAVILPAMLEKAMNEYAMHQCQELLENQKEKKRVEEPPIDPEKNYFGIKSEVVPGGNNCLVCRYSKELIYCEACAYCINFNKATEYYIK